MPESNFPSSLDTDANSSLPKTISNTAALNNPNHAEMHGRSNDAIIEVETKLGTGSSSASTGAVLIGTGSGASAWDTTPTFVGDVTIPEGDLILGSTAVTSTAAEINLLDGSTAGTVVASKAVVVDANKDIASFRNVTLTGELDAATLDISGDVDIDGAADIAGDLVLSGGADGALQFTNAGENSIKIPDNQASALIIEEADNAYITFTTTDSSEAITVAKATTFSSTVNIDGNVDVDANTQLDGTLTVGLNDTGHDVKFHGATDGKYFEWDESADRVNIEGTLRLALHSSPNYDAATLICGNNTDTTPDGNWNGHFVVDGNGYTGGISLDENGMWVGHNTSSRDLYLAVNETVKLRVMQSGEVIAGLDGADYPGTDPALGGQSTSVALGGYRNSSTASHDVFVLKSDVNSTGGVIFYVEADGDVFSKTNSYGAFPSDNRLKTTETCRDYYEDLRKLEVINYQMTKDLKDNGDGTVDIVDLETPSKKMLGFVAQEVEKHIPGLVTTDQHGYKGIRTTVLIPMLLQMCQKLADKVEALEG